MRDLNAKEVMSVVKIIDLDAKVSAKKTIMAPVFETDGSNIHTAMILMN